MSRKVLDSNIGDADVDVIMNNIIAQNPQLNAQIEQVHNESNIFLCKLLRIYPYDDKAYVKILNTNRNVFCRLSHEIIGGGMSIDYLPNGREVVDNKKLKGRSYIEPFDDLYGILVKVRWLNLDDENVLLGYVNVYDDYNLKSNSNKGELLLQSGQSSISIDDERVNIMTPALFINGLPFNEPELLNYYNKKDSDIISNSLQDQSLSLNNQVNTRLDENIDELKNSINSNHEEVNNKLDSHIEELSNKITENEIIVDTEFDTESTNPISNNTMSAKIKELEDRLDQLEYIAHIKTPTND